MRRVATWLTLMNMEYDRQLKGQCHEMDIFLKVLNILSSTFCVCADGFQDFSKAFHYPIQLLTLIASLKLLTVILKMLTESLLKSLLSMIDRCSLVPISHWLQGNAQEVTCHRWLAV